MAERILVTGGAGFVGSNLAVRLKTEQPGREVVVLDNLSRDGSELTVPRLLENGIEFTRGDVRALADIEKIGAVDWLIECSAEPSVHAGYGLSPRYLIDTNLVGAINCLEHLRTTGGRLIFLSSSRVYPIRPLRDLPLERQGDRMTIAPGRSGQGFSVAGISEDFPILGPRSMYGATKLAAELLIAEYGAMYGTETVINRCGVLAGPWQFGKVDQGFIALWVARHIYGGKLAYMGFGGDGTQVRDILHVDDLFQLIRLQMAKIADISGEIFNVGGGAAVSVSLRELTAICQKITGHRVEIGADPTTRDADIPYYVTNNARVTARLGWHPSIDAAAIAKDVHAWISADRDRLAPIFT